MCICIFLSCGVDVVVLLRLHNMSLSLGAEVKVVVMLDFLSIRRSCGPTSGM